MRLRKLITCALHSRVLRYLDPLKLQRGQPPRYGRPLGIFHVTWQLKRAKEFRSQDRLPLGQSAINGEQKSLLILR
jgi:hypothetical protein